ncbi:MAG: aspartate carbamoyltransferase catalytic subunit [Culicoidibacterales bacterium]
MRNFLTLGLLSLETIEALIDKGLAYKQTQTAPNLMGKYITNVFFENSTRTKTSFEMAQKKSKMEIILFDASTSSASKGESLYDTIKTLEAVGCDAVVVRSSENKYYEKLIGNCEMAIINGGDGTSDHPSQSLLDLMTIKEHFGKIINLNIVIVGDVLHSRVAHANIAILNRMGAKITIAAPPKWQDHTLENVAYAPIDNIIETADVIMLLRCQTERHTSTYGFQDFLSEYGLTIHRANQMKETSIIMHPAPVNRNVEIAESLIESPKSKIFEQMKNGTYARMAILDYVFTEKRK